MIHVVLDTGNEIGRKDDSNIFTRSNRKMSCHYQRNAVCRVSLALSFEHFTFEVSIS